MIVSCHPSSILLCLSACSPHMTYARCALREGVCAPQGQPAVDVEAATIMLLDTLPVSWPSGLGERSHQPEGLVPAHRACLEAA